MPRYAERCRQLTQARADNPWLADGSVVIQQQAIRDHGQAMANFLAGSHRRPKWRKAGRDEGFRIVHVESRDVRRLSRKVGEVRIPKAGWVRFRWSRQVPDGVKSFRVSRDRAGRWHIAFAFIPDPVSGPGGGETVGIDRGVAVSVVLSTGETFRAPGLTERQQDRLLRLQRTMARRQRGSNRRETARAAIAKLRACEADRRKDWCEKVSTDIARRFDVIRIEDLNVRNMVRSAKGTARMPGRSVRQKTGLNRAIHRSGWGLLARRLDDKAQGRVEYVTPVFTSQRCSACGHIAAENRESQARFCCVACHFACNADVNAAINIAAGHAVTARGRSPLGERVNREPQLLASLT
jgi:IS605 OrfB family transposase